ncbi:MAG: hypothetical protein QW728_00305 [Thermoplasmata archaeon]
MSVLTKQISRGRNMLPNEGANEEDNGWRFHNAVSEVFAMLISFSGAFFLISFILFLSIRVVLTKHYGNYLIGIIISVIVTIILLDLGNTSYKCIISIRNYYSKVFGYADSTASEVIEKLLGNNHILYKKKGSMKVHFGLKFSEIFELTNSGIHIKIQTKNERGTGIWIGPKNSNTQSEIERLMKQIDEGLKPLTLCKPSGVSKENPRSGETRSSIHSRLAWFLFPRLQNIIILFLISFLFFISFVVLLLLIFSPPTQLVELVLLLTYSLVLGLVSVILFFTITATLITYTNFWQASIYYPSNEVACAIETVLEKNNIPYHKKGSFRKYFVIYYQEVFELYKSGIQIRIEGKFYSLLSIGPENKDTHEEIEILKQILSEEFRPIGVPWV